MKEAYNLISLLLCKDPSQRLTMSRVLQHPFVSGNRPLRLVNERATYDVFISYRPDADFTHASQLYPLLYLDNLILMFKLYYHQENHKKILFVKDDPIHVYLFRSYQDMLFIILQYVDMLSLSYHLIHLVIVSY